MRAFWVDSTPDTGCTITLLNLDVALRNGIHIDRTKTVELYHAAGGSMHMEGMTNIHVCPNNIQATLQVAVSSELKETMLISCDDLCKLRVIPADFPNATARRVPKHYEPGSNVISHGPNTGARDRASAM